MREMAKEEKDKERVCRSGEIERRQNDHEHYEA